jgi:S-layer like family, C-terminal region
MNILVDLSVNLFAALIGFLVGVLVQMFQKKIRAQKAKFFWRPFLSDDTRVVLGRFSAFPGFERSGFIGFGDALGLAELQSHYLTLDLKDLIVTYDNRIHGDELKNNLILIGGPDVNRITREVVAHIDSKLKFGNPDQHEIFIQDVSTKKIYAPFGLSSSFDDIKLDYGLILKAKSPFDPSKYVLVIAGSFGYGTWAGVRHATSKKFMANPIVARNHQVECLIETDIALETPQEIREVVLRKLDK